MRRSIEIGFAAISRVAVAIAEARSASDSTTSRRARGRTSCWRTFRAAGIAVVDIGIEVNLTAVARKAIAIFVTSVAGAHRASAIDAGGSRVSEAALVAASVTIVDVSLDIDLTAIRRRGVTVIETRTAGAHGAHATDTTGSRIGVGTLGATIAAIVDVCARIDLATVPGQAIAILGGRHANRNVITASAGYANGRAASRGAYVSACSAVGNVRTCVNFATIIGVAITIGKAGIAGADRAGAVVAGCRSIRVSAYRTTAAAMSRIRLEIGLATIGRGTITIIIAWSAGPQRAHAAVTACHGIREATDLRTAVAVVGVGGQICFAAVGN